MALKELLLSALLYWQPPWYPPGKNPETTEEYRSRLTTIAEAVAIEAQALPPSRLDARSLAAAALTVWYGETRFAYEVHALGRSRWGQDRGKARCMGQLHMSKLVPRAEWEKMVGADLESTRRCARATMRVLLAMARYCGARGTSESSMAHVFAAYGSGAGCTLDTRAKRRAGRWARLLRQI